MPAYFVDYKTPIEQPLRGYFMRHKSGEIGFSWKHDNHLFGPDWERIPAVVEAEQLSPAHEGSINKQDFQTFVDDRLGIDVTGLAYKELVAFIDAWATRRTT